LWILCKNLRHDGELTLVCVALVGKSGLQSSKSEARRTIKGGGCRVNNRKVDSEAQVVAAEDLLEGRLMLLASGKKNKLLVRVAE
jgi:tyrosyl-tRNA synthetase